jgi:hypothetical protein
VVGVTAGSAVGASARRVRQSGPRGGAGNEAGSGDGDGGDSDGDGDGDGDGGGGDGGGRHSAARSADVRRGRSSALHRHVCDELLQVIVGDVPCMERGERVATAACSSKRRQCTRTARAWRGRWRWSQTCACACTCTL